MHELNKSDAAKNPSMNGLPAVTYPHKLKRSTPASKRSIVGGIKDDLWQKKRDLFRLKLKYLDSETPIRVPIEVQIEATSKCNLRCPECAHSRDNEAGKHLSTGELNLVLDKLPFSVKRVILSGIGEPLLNPEYFSLVDFLAERQIICRFITNGTLLTPQTCEKIIQRRNIDYVVISCDGAEKKTFENLRMGASFDKWTQFVRYFSNRVNEERPDLTISINTVITKQNLNQLEGIIQMVADLGCHRILFLDPIAIDDMAVENIASKEELSAINFKDLFKLGSLLGLKVAWSIRRDIVPPGTIPRCLRPWDSLFIRANGNVLPCPANFSNNKVEVMGNIFQKDFESIWNGDRFREYRRTSVKGMNSLCRACSFY
jgi:radical SAM protein with 4Fe4S-binding SPASM domain